MCVGVRAKTISTYDMISSNLAIFQADYLNTYIQMIPFYQMRRPEELFYCYKVI